MRYRHPLLASILGLMVAASLACSDEAPPTKTTAKQPPPPVAKPPDPPSAPVPVPVPTPPPSTQASPEELAEEGRGVYMSNCIACHNADPSVDGALGPAIKGSSAELLRARVVKGVYPPGYEPKRDSSIMVALPHLEPNIDALAAFLAE